MPFFDMTGIFHSQAIGVAATLHLPPDTDESLSGSPPAQFRASPRKITPGAVLSSFWPEILLARASPSPSDWLKDRTWTKAV